MRVGEWWCSDVVILQQCYLQWLQSRPFLIYCPVRPCCSFTWTFPCTLAHLLANCCHYQLEQPEHEVWGAVLVQAPRLV